MSLERNDVYRYGRVPVYAVYHAMVYNGWLCNPDWPESQLWKAVINRQHLVYCSTRGILRMIETLQTQSR